MILLYRPDKVKLDRNLSEKLGELTKGTSRIKKEIATGQKVAYALSKRQRQSWSG
ncbi:MAG: hypothetical protein HS132_13775 [Planctomycetia bacterium]|nr:hypothetical protein [Planctomycetia bacterium]